MRGRVAASRQVFYDSALFVLFLSVFRWDAHVQSMNEEVDLHRGLCPLWAIRAWR